MHLELSSVASLIKSLDGEYGFKNPPPVIPGGEGSGTVVAVGPGPMGRYFLGKRVACLWGGSKNGVWSEYAVVSAKGGALPLHDTVDLEQAERCDLDMGVDHDVLLLRHRRERAW